MMNGMHRDDVGDDDGYVRDDAGDGHNANGGHDENLAGGIGGRLP